ncbi:uncharacterized protein LOC141605540 [Silene latifolia]|uniref:uncharacterized protein LOC141605540 n=1 Tax=Silene latifolia TaxID=37657 RepID=UPI003D773429
MDGKKNSTSISQETPTDKPESSNKNASSTNTGFKFEIKPANKLKTALTALCDQHFNPTGSARMDVDHQGFQLTVWNVETRVVAHLRLRPNNTTNFCFNPPLQPKMIDLKSFYWDLFLAAEHSIVSIYHFHDSNLLCFTYGSGTEANKEFSVDLTELDSNFGKFPGFISTYGITMQTTHFRYITSLMNHVTPQRVLVQIAEHSVRITVGDKKWQYQVHEADGIKQSNAGEEHQVWFQWPHVDSIIKASLLENKFFLGFDTSGAEENTLMMRFFIKKRWDLTYIRLLKTCSKEHQASQQNPSINSFSFEIKPAHKLKQAIAALCDQEFNPRGLARMDVDDQGFELTVWNVETRVIGHLRLRANDSNNYSYSSPLEPNMIDLNRVFSGLEFAADDDIVFIYHLHGSNLLGFKFGDPVTEFLVDLTELDSNFKNFPGFTTICGTSIPTQHLRELIPPMVQEGTPQKVLLHIIDKDVSIIVGDSTMPGEVLQEHKVWFEWPHGDALMKASRLEELFYLGFGASDVKCDTLMMRFFVKERWNLAFVRLNCCFVQTD